jgi:hypothetical protein
MMQFIRLEKTVNFNPPTCAEVALLATVQSTLAGSRQQTAMPPEICVVINQYFDTSKWGSKLDEMKRLQEGWNGYSAPVPSGAAIDTARSFLSILSSENYEPTKLAPSAVGGVGITRKEGGRRVYVEFFNDGEVFALFSDRKAEPVSKQVLPGDRRYRALLKEIKEYLNA